MHLSRLPRRRILGALLPALFLAASLFGQTPPPADPIPYDADAAPLILARKYLEGGPDSRAAVLEALERMGWGVRNAKGEVVKAPPANASTGLALRDYELEELLWNPAEQPTVRLISVAQALAVPFEDADPEELAQDLVETIRKGAESTQPQQRFWAKFIIALGRVSPANYDLAGSPPPAVMQPSNAQLKEIEQLAKKNPMAMMQPSVMLAMQPKSVWPENDPVLKPSPKPKRAESDTRSTSAERDQKRMDELSAEMGKMAEEMGSSDPARQKKAQEQFAKVSVEMAAISQRMAAANMQQMNSALAKIQKAKDGEADENDDDSGPRTMAEFRDQPLSLLQIALISKVLAADVRLAAAKGGTGHASRWMPPLPLAAIGVQVAQAGGPTSFGDQISGALGDIWATGWGAYTGEVLEHHLPGNKFSKAAGIANTIIAWYKTIMTVARQKITIEVENAPLVRTKNRSAGQQRTAKAKVEIDFPKSDVLKAIRAAGNLTTIDLQMPDGGPVSGAKVVWRLPEGSYNGKYQTAKGGWEYRPDLAVVQFAEGAGYVSMTNDAGEATIQIEGVPQKKILPSTVRPYPRRAAIAVEVTIKVGNLTQDLNDAINTAMGGPITGALGFIADMVLRTSFFFQAGKVFEVTDWKEPAWEGDFKITVKGAGSKHEKGEKGGPDQDYAWSMDRYMEGHLHTPDWEEENEEKKNYEGYGRHKLEVDGDTRAFSLKDSSSSRSKNSNNRYQADGPLQITAKGGNGLTYPGRSEPSGSATLTLTGGKSILDLEPFFGAECLVVRSEQNRGRSNNSSGPQYLSLLNGVSPGTFSVIGDAPEDAEYVEGSKTLDCTGNLPFVPSFDVTVTVKYRLWKSGAPPKNKPR